MDGTLVSASAVLLGAAMLRRRRFARAVLIGCALWGSTTHADSIRCGGALIQEGMASAEVTEKCGQPTTVEVVEEPIMARRPNGSTYPVGVVTREYWSYDRGPQLFPVRVTIEEGVATKIELLSRHESD